MNLILLLKSAAFSLLLLISLDHAYASPNNRHPVLECLGNEELLLHKAKITGPLYKLNQSLIDELTASSDLIIKKEYVQNICDLKEFNVSVNLLKSLLMEGIKLYQFSGNENILALQKATAKDLLDRIPNIFFQYIAGIQGQTSFPQCLQKKISELEYFTTRFYYLEEEISAVKIFRDKDKLHKVFDGLKRLDKIEEECKKLAKEEQAKTKT